MPSILFSIYSFFEIYLLYLENFAKYLSHTGKYININSVYFQNDLEVLQGFIDNNKSLAGKQPLEIGQQKWENMRLVSLDLSDKELTAIPTSICSILPNLKSFDKSAFVYIQLRKLS